MYYVNRLYDFLDRLAANNNREWFAANKGEYDELRAHWLADIDRMIHAMMLWCPQMAGQSARNSAYRIYRDTRFSPDKTPYKTFFSAATGPFGRKTNHAGFYIEIGNARTYGQGLYGGVWELASPELKKVRRAIVDNIEEWEEIVQEIDLQGNFPKWCGSELKTVPQGWSRNHPQARYLRMKNYGRFREMPRDFFLDPQWPLRSAELFSTLKPFVDFINYSIDE